MLTNILEILRWYIDDIAISISEDSPWNISESSVSLSDELRDFYEEIYRQWFISLYMLKACKHRGIVSMHLLIRRRKIGQFFIILKEFIMRRHDTLHFRAILGFLNRECID
jgi:hypothetical protein